jgi:hypothetical protein
MCPNAAPAAISTTTITYKHVNVPVRLRARLSVMILGRVFAHRDTSIFRRGLRPASRTAFVWGGA